MGVTNGWSLYGGAIGESNYQAVALGSGKDLGVVGAVAVDITRTPSPTCRKTTGLTAKRCRVTHIASATPVTLMKSTAD
ncbi:fimbria/pilus outer membrane usher protein [Salmonella enterica subsp. enterica serovar Gallinarum]|nr:fimbria/pilus outer membrane usher protein [Salmonella enterica subsp. enterica serovar Gallinarum]